MGSEGIHHLRVPASKPNLPKVTYHDTYTLRGKEYGIVDGNFPPIVRKHNCHDVAYVKTVKYIKPYPYQKEHVPQKGGNYHAQYNIFLIWFEKGSV